MAKVAETAGLCNAIDKHRLRLWKAEQKAAAFLTCQHSHVTEHVSYQCLGMAIADADGMRRKLTSALSPTSDIVAHKWQVIAPPLPTFSPWVQHSLQLRLLLVSNSY